MGQNAVANTAVSLHGTKGKVHPDQGGSSTSDGSQVSVDRMTAQLDEALRTLQRLPLSGHSEVVALQGQLNALHSSFQAHKEELARTPRSARRWSAELGSSRANLENSAQFALSLIIVFPAIIGLVCLVFGGIISAAEEWPDVTGGFFYLMACVCGMVNPLTPLNPSSTVGILWAGLISFCSLGISGLVVSLVTSQPLIAHFALWMSKTVKRATPAGRHAAIMLKVGLIAFLVVIVTPILMWGATCLLAAVMAAAEGWLYSDAIAFVAGDLAGFPNPVVNVMPVTVFGRFFASVEAIWGLILSSLVQGIFVSSLLDDRA